MLKYHFELKFINVFIVKIFKNKKAENIKNVFYIHGQNLAHIANEMIQLWHISTTLQQY